MGCVDHAKNEFKYAGYKPVEECGDDPNKWIQESVLELLEVFSKQGHSGSSAPFCVEYFSKLALQKPITPIKCTDDEWSDISDISNNPTFQNKRESSVFKHGGDGKPYYLDAIVFRGQTGNCFTSNSVELKSGGSIGSRQYIRLPFVPKTFYIDVIETEWADKNETVKKEGGGWWTSVVKDESQLGEVFEYYDKYR